VSADAEDPPGPVSDGGSGAGSTGGGTKPSWTVERSGAAEGAAVVGSVASATGGPAAALGAAGSRLRRRSDAAKVGLDFPDVTASAEVTLAPGGGADKKLDPAAIALALGRNWSNVEPACGGDGIWDHGRAGAEPAPGSTAASDEGGGAVMGTAGVSSWSAG